MAVRAASPALAPAAPPALAPAASSPGLAPPTPATPATTGTTPPPPDPRAALAGLPAAATPPVTSSSTSTSPPSLSSSSEPDVAAAVDEVKVLLDQGRITRAVDILGGVLPAAAARHGHHSPVVRTLRKQYAATLMDDGQYRRALPELRQLAEELAKETGPAATRQALQFHYEAAQCLEQLGEVTQALEEYRALLPYFERYPDAPTRPLEIRRSIGHLLLAQGDHTAAQDSLTRLLYDAERLHGPHHAFPGEVRRMLHWLGQVRG